VKKTLLNAVIAVICSRMFETLIAVGGENISLYERTCLWLLVFLCVKQVLEEK